MRCAAPKTVKAVQRGKASIDTGAPPNIIASSQVYEDPATGTIYDCTLNQVNIGRNNNKFYIIQVWQAHGMYTCWQRWGRVGENVRSRVSLAKPRRRHPTQGQNATQGPFGIAQQAISAFEKSPSSLPEAATSSDRLCCRVQGQDRMGMGAKVRPSLRFVLSHRLTSTGSGTRRRRKTRSVSSPLASSPWPRR